MPAPNGCGIILFFQAAFPKSLQEVDSGLDSGLRCTHSSSRNPPFNQVRSPYRYPSFSDKITGQGRPVAENQPWNIRGPFPPTQLCSFTVPDPSLVPLHPHSSSSAMHKLMSWHWSGFPTSPHHPRPVNCNLRHQHRGSTHPPLPPCNHHHLLFCTQQVAWLSLCFPTLALSSGWQWGRRTAAASTLTVPPASNSTFFSMAKTTGWLMKCLLNHCSPQIISRHAGGQNLISFKFLL